jgi:hypothetical protein
VRKALALVASGLAAACLSAAAADGDPVKPAAGDPVKPDPGAGPHRNYDEQKGGPGAKPRSGDPQPQFPKPAPSGASKDGAEGASTGSSSDKDERKATESKEKAKKRPGYKDDAPSPRA